MKTQKNETPYNIRIEKARNYLRYQINAATVKYNLPGAVMDLILESLLREEDNQRIALMTEQYDVVEEELSKAREENERCQELVKNLNKSQEPDTEKRSEEQSMTP